MVSATLGRKAACAAGAPRGDRGERRDRGDRGDRGERGYNLVAVMVAITILNIALAAVLPAWSHAIRREKEEELIFRGLQYAEAIRVYRARYNSLPTRLEQLIEVKPRCIRQLWKDPMREDGKWALVFEGQPLQPQTPGDDQDGGDGDSGDGGPAGADKSAFGLPASGQTVTAGPIKGVYSLSDKESILVFFGQQKYNKWVFTVDMLQGGQQPGAPPPPPPQPGQPNPSGGLVLSTRWLGRPLPPSIAGPPPGTLPDGTPIIPGPGLPGINNPGGGLRTPGFPVGTEPPIK